MGDEHFKGRLLSSKGRRTTNVMYTSWEGNQRCALPTHVSN
jgi:hypothetical protein